jgi:hypothetical protein
MLLVPFLQQIAVAQLDRWRVTGDGLTPICVDDLFTLVIHRRLPTHHSPPW